MSESPNARARLDRLLDGIDMSETEASQLLALLTDPELAPALAGALLAALRAKGITAAELRGFAQRMRAMARRPELPRLPDAVDIVGTGGDRSGSLNLSTASALLAAACGLPVFKHGNRSLSSCAGSADVLEALGLPLPLDEAAAGRCFTALHFTFLFAPYYHSATKSIAPVRAALGVRTVFNILGPLSNPAEPPFLVVGAFDAATAELMAQALHGTHVKRAFVIHGAEGWDEPTPVGEFTLFDVTAAGVRREQRSPADYGLAVLRLERTGRRRCGPQCARDAARALRRAPCGQRCEPRSAPRRPVIGGGTRARSQRPGVLAARGNGAGRAGH